MNLNNPFTSSTDMPKALARFFIASGSFVTAAVSNAGIAANTLGAFVGSIAIAAKAPSDCLKSCPVLNQPIDLLNIIL